MERDVDSDSSHSNDWKSLEVAGTLESNPLRHQAMPCGLRFHLQPRNPERKVIPEHASEFFGRPVVDFDPERGLERPDEVVYRLRLDWDAHDSGTRIADLLAPLLNDAAVGRVEALVIGDWGHAAEGNDAAIVVEALVASRERLAGLRALFLGDIIGEEAEISWIQQTDIAPLWVAFPQMRHLRVRGGNGLALGTPRHEQLEALIIESGGLPGEVIESVARAELPRLEHLELWLGTDEYGGVLTVDSLAPILAGDRFPNLHYLGLRDSIIADAVAAAVAQSPLLERIRVLDLSLGTLTDEGAEALLAAPAVKRLERLDLHHHFLSDAMMQRVQALGIDVDLSEQEEGDDDDGEVWRYVAVSE